MARGGNTALLHTDGTVTTANGTSFSCPIMAGAVTCLCQAFSNMRPVDIMNAVRQTGNFYDQPNEVYGNGIPNILEAYYRLGGK